jgi:hypothetical protein
MRILLAVVLLAACGGGQTARPPDSSASPPRPSPTQIDVSDMMGAFPPATFFVVLPGNVTAVALLNHATKYTITTEGGEAQVATAPESSRVYILDAPASGTRLRWFDVATGVERASYVATGMSPGATGIGHGAIAVDHSTGAVFALLRDGSRLRLAEFDRSTLAPKRDVLDDLRCGDRIAADGGRVAVACLGEGGLVVGDGSGTAKFSANGPLVALAIAPNGTAFAAAADGTIFRQAPGRSDLETISALRERGARVVADGVVAQADCCLVVAMVDRVPNPEVRLVTGGFTFVLFPAAAAPSAGIHRRPCTRRRSRATAASPRWAGTTSTTRTGWSIPFSRSKRPSR